MSVKHIELRRQDRQAPDELAWKLLKECEYATLATVNEDGSPYCVPISPVLVGETLYFHGALAGQKWHNFQRDTRVCVSCVGQTRLRPEHFTTEFESAVAHGRISSITDPEQKIAIMRLICEKYAPENLENFPAAMNKSTHRTGIFQITIEAISAKRKQLPQK